MSAQTRQPDAPDGDDAPPDIDAYAVEIPESFVQAYPEAETVQEALRLAEAAPPADGNADASTCPRCSSVRLAPKSNGTQGHKRTEGYVCETCGLHVSDPDDPERAEMVFPDGQQQLEEWL